MAVCSLFKYVCLQNYRHARKEGANCRTCNQTSRLAGTRTHTYTQRKDSERTCIQGDRQETAGGSVDGIVRTWKNVGSCLQ